MATLIEIVEIAEDGSVLTPESLRKEVGLDVEARLVVSVVDGTLVIEPFEA